ncbi:MAG TPA: response regulator, partial [Acidimicrobiales bacterium]
MRLLVVDDEVDLADAVATGLRREGHAVDVAYDGDAALDLLAVDEYDLVLLDVAMPGANDGLAVCRAIREGAAAGPMPRVLMLTARDTVDDRVTGL